MSFYSHEKIYGTDGLITLVPLTLNTPPGIPSLDIIDITHYEHMISDQSIISRPGPGRVSSVMIRQRRQQPRPEFTGSEN